MYEIPKSMKRINDAVAAAALIAVGGICLMLLVGAVWVFVGILVSSAKSQTLETPPAQKPIEVRKASLEIACVESQYAERLAGIPRERAVSRLLFTDGDGDGWYVITDSSRTLPGVVGIHVKTNEAFCLVVQEDARPKA